MDIGELVGLNVRRVRTLKGLTQEDLSAASGVSQQYISGLESGARNPTVETLAILARALKVSHVELVAIPDGVRLRLPKPREK